ncbi:hypothetical protein LPB72_06700 [Hydrogenophaga crassostreae]|uniref:HTH tetR-type domain-containing protein n=2 Tax=Hydrogenophaga crassostreae TaxID=1763535 RepID=A0A162T263_9BURK|nr:hypothetical protein LPB072_10680 [Hydrogenophaga crassostreae]OAD42603.1 hypothetical protein LPB72_06700 [Hydrogenophaga crassostreae]
MTVPLDAITPVPGPVEREKAKAREQGRRERQQRTAAMRRQHLLDVAWALLVEGGPHSFNMRDLGARAGYTAGALYSYFPSRDHLIGELRRRLLRSLSDRVGRTFKQGKKVVAVDQQRIETKAWSGEPLSAGQHQELFDRCTLTWWQVLSSDPNAMTLLLTGHRSNVAECRGQVSDDAPRDLLVELSEATQACTLALEEAGFASAEALAVQQQILCFAVGLLVAQPSCLSTPGGRKAASRRFANVVRALLGKAPGEENGGGGECTEAEGAQVNLF